jgi:hypothetical protein
MSAPKHTRGPWEVSMGGAEVRPTRDGGVGLGPVARIVRRDGHMLDDARLIAAAPELLEACKAALAGEDKGFTLSPKTADLLTAAIAKAGGRS